MIAHYILFSEQSQTLLKFYSTKFSTERQLNRLMIGHTYWSYSHHKIKTSHINDRCNKALLCWNVPLNPNQSISVIWMPMQIY